MAIQPERHDSEKDIDTVDTSINARLTHHLMDNAAREDVASSAPTPRAGFISRLLVAGGTMFLMSILSIYSLLDRRQRYL